MKYFKFEEEDILRNVVRTTPHYKFKISGGVVYNNVRDTLEFRFQPVEVSNPPPPELLDCGDNENKLVFACPVNSQYLGVI
jgi:hypothetical protein